MKRGNLCANKSITFNKYLIPKLFVQKGKLQPQRLRLQQLKVRRPHGSSSNVEFTFGVNHAPQCSSKNYENKRTALYKSHPNSEINPVHLRRLAASKLVIASVCTRYSVLRVILQPPKVLHLIRERKVSFPSLDELWQYIRHTSCPLKVSKGLASILTSLRC